MACGYLTFRGYSNAQRWQRFRKEQLPLGHGYTNQKSTNLSENGYLFLFVAKMAHGYRAGELHNKDNIAIRPQLSSYISSKLYW
jgi:hypothetical protein